MNDSALPAAIPTSLPCRLLLLAVTDRHHRTSGQLQILLRAAALTELFLGAHLIDDDGRARAQLHSAVPDPLLVPVLHHLLRRPTRPWAHWLHSRSLLLLGPAREQLSRSGWIIVGPRGVLGVRTRLTPPVGAALAQLTRRVDEVLAGASPVDALDRHDIATAALRRRRTALLSS